jgi:hypothetical protein
MVASVDASVGRIPRTGAALFAWTRLQEERHRVDLLKYLNNWARRSDVPGWMVEWSPDQVRLAHAEAVRKLRMAGARP